MEEWLQQILIREQLNHLSKHNLKIATVESITGGKIINALTDIPGFSNHIYGGLITYHDDAKIGLLNGKYDDVYTKEYAEYMAQQGFQKMDVDVIIAITGNADRTKNNKEYELYFYRALTKHSLKDIKGRLKYSQLISNEPKKEETCQLHSCSILKDPERIPNERGSALE